MSTRKDHMEVTSDQPRQAVTSPAEVLRMRSISPTVLGLTLRVQDRAFTFYAGQWVDFAVPGTTLVGGYSMCSSPWQLQSEGTLELAVKQSSWPPAKWVHTQCREGSRVTLTAGGAFFYHAASEARARPLLLVAGGVGINPLLSILRFCDDLQRDNTQSPPPRHALLYSSASRAELLFKEHIEALQDSGVVRAQFFATREDPPDKEDNVIRRRLTSADLAAAVRQLGGSPRCFLCGPSAMIADVERWLHQLGVPPQDVLYERWW